MKEITGNATVGFNDSDIEGDFDPAAHDAAMNLVFSDDYYQREEDGEKPVFTDSEEEDGGLCNHIGCGSGCGH